MYELSDRPSAASRILIGPSGLVEFTGHFWQAQEGNCAPFPDESRQSGIEVIHKTIWDTPVW